jgi:hypothetical protein
MLIVTVNRTVALIKCKHPEYNKEIKVEYQCNIQTNQWKLIYENDNFTCRKLKKFYKKIINLFYLADYIVPPMAILINGSRSYRKVNITSKKFLLVFCRVEIRDLHGVGSE